MTIDPWFRAPSPVMATTSPRSCHAATMSTFCSGRVRAYTVISWTRSMCSPRATMSPSAISWESAVIPIWSAMARAVAAWSPVTSTVRMPASRSEATTSAAPGGPGLRWRRGLSAQDRVRGADVRAAGCAGNQRLPGLCAHSSDKDRTCSIRVSCGRSVTSCVRVLVSMPGRCASPPAPGRDPTRHPDGHRGRTAFVANKWRVATPSSCVRTAGTHPDQRVWWS